ncbi:polysaccharide deacetylase family protein [Brevibacillus borstelensis]|uniref:polysaccharide deacetylase family protein n=1 Tax=Brevibacillus borstelensis TaxID=45462 RepID=UPI0030BD6F9C
MNKAVTLRILFTVSCAVLLTLTLNYRPIDQYIEAVKIQSVTADKPIAGERDEELRRKIDEWKQGKEEAPIDARIDRVWRAIPGYNGLAVNVEASLEKLKSSGTIGPEALVFEEIPPAITLEKLGAHPIYRGNPQKPAISFMINVAWGNEYLDAILDTLDKHHVKTTFFLDGSWVKRYPELAKKIAERGHEIGNHAYSHPDMANIGLERMRQEIAKTQDVIQKTLGIKPVLFAPPSGSFNQTVVNIAHNEYQMKTILWTADTVDWRKPPVDEMVRRIGEKMDNGVLILMHPTEPTAAGLDRMIQDAKKKGLLPLPVSEVISSKRLR